jgi:predicted phosphodiesterase
MNQDNGMPINYRVALLADIHGNQQALEAVLNDLEHDQPLDGILVAGDIIAGPGQQQVLDRLIELDAVMIQGNNERAIATMTVGTAPEHVYTTRQFALRRWACDHLGEAQKAFIRSLPEQTVFQLPGADPIRMAHGSPDDINELVFPDHFLQRMRKVVRMLPTYGSGRIDEIFAAMAERVLVLGHVHLPWHERRAGHLMLNPGALNFPCDGWVGAQYALLHWDGDAWTPEMRAVRYDLEAYQRASQDSGFLATGILARMFLEEIMTGVDIASDFMILAQELANEAGYENLPYFPDDVWELAERNFLA